MTTHKLRKSLVFFIAAAVLLTVLPAPLPTMTANAQTDPEEGPNFLTEYDITYDIKENGETEVTQSITITNLKSGVIVTSYSLSINQMEIYDISGMNNEKKITIAEKKDDENNLTTLTANFADHVIGEGRQNKLMIVYKSRDIAAKFGEIWNVTIPKIELSESTTRYNLNILVPSSFGKKIYITPQPDIEDENGDKFMYAFTKESLNNKSVNASFGEFQHVNFNLKYQIENPYLLSSTYEIALPPDIQGAQQIKYASIDPEPARIYIDDDGNTMAHFRLKSKQKLEIIVKGTARIAGHQINPSLGGKVKDIPNYIYDRYTASQKYWETDSSNIKEISNELHDPNKNVSQNAKAIYDYIVSNLNYNFDLIDNGSVTSIERQGAEKAADPETPGVCMEFTDLFIALARSMGIPARELNGYAFTNEDSNKPLSISFSGADLLHSWPEFYDPNFGWIQIDPTWGNTSGVDYFTKLDTNHFVFAIRGSDSEYPVPAGAYRFEGNNDEQLIDVEFSQKEDKEEFEYNIDIKKTFNWNIIKLIQGYNRYKATNTGKTFIYDLQGTNLAPGNSKVIYLKKGSTTVDFFDFNNSPVSEQLP